jgi:hypothetical protein
MRQSRPFSRVQDLIVLMAVAADHRDVELQAGAGIAASRIVNIHDPSAASFLNRSEP